MLRSWITWLDSTAKASVFVFFFNGDESDLMGSGKHTYFVLVNLKIPYVFINAQELIVSSNTRHHTFTLGGKQEADKANAWSAVVPRSGT